MEQSLIHRGPDEGNVVVFPDGSGGFAARRLSLLDLRNGSQPIPNEDGTVHVLHNGEIYNHRGLRDELQARGHCLRSRTDSEVIAHLYEDDGVECLHRLHGMFALALYDARKRQLLLARDGPGMKPLYFANTRAGFLFASEARALFASGLIRPEPELPAIDTYLAIGYVPAPACAFRNVGKLRAGHYLLVEKEKMRDAAFSRYEYRQPSPAKSDAEYGAELEALLSGAVRSHLAADVPVGALLSGGWDSSLIATLAARNMGAPLKTFSIVFPEDPEADESRFSRAMAESLGSDHHEIEYRNSLLPALIPKMSRDLEEPCANVPTGVVSLLASLAGAHVKSVVSGEGADELFGGYKFFRIRSPYLARAVLPRSLARFAATWLPHPLVRCALRVAAAPDERTGDPEWFRMFSPEEKRMVLKPEFQVDGPDVSPTLVERETLVTCVDRLQRRLAFDLTGRLADGILFMADKVAMSHSLEVRMPFLDRSVVEFAMRLPSHLKVNGRQGKVILRPLASRLLPPAIASRRKKGLAYPDRAWSKPPLDRYARDLLLGGGRNGPFNTRYLEQNLPRWQRAAWKGERRIAGLVFLQSWWNEFC